MITLTEAKEALARYDLDTVDAYFAQVEAEVDDFIARCAELRRQIDERRSQNDK
jgi:hypothetical protein